MQFISCTACLEGNSLQEKGITKVRKVYGWEGERDKKMSRDLTRKGNMSPS
jgi:hypothetical protein